MINKAKSSLVSQDVSITGVVLNNINITRDDYYYYYHTYYSDYMRSDEPTEGSVKNEFNKYFQKFSTIFIFVFLILLTFGCVNTKLDNGVIELVDSNAAEAYKLNP